MSADQLHRLNAPIDKGFDGVMITTKQQGGTCIILYAAQHGRMDEFKDTFTNILHSVAFVKMDNAPGQIDSIPRSLTGSENKTIPK